MQANLLMMIVCNSSLLASCCSDPIVQTLHRFPPLLCDIHISQCMHSFQVMRILDDKKNPAILSIVIVWNKWVKSAWSADDVRAPVPCSKIDLKGIISSCAERWQVQLDAPAGRKETMCDFLSPDWGRSLHPRTLGRLTVRFFPFNLVPEGVSRKLTPLDQ